MKIFSVLFFVFVLILLLLRQAAALSDTDQLKFRELVGQIKPDAEAWVKDKERKRICQEKLGRDPMKRTNPFFIKDACLAFHISVQRFDPEFDFDDYYKGVLLLHKRPQKTVTSAVEEIGTDAHYDIWKFKVDALKAKVDEHMSGYETNLRSLRCYTNGSLCNENFRGKAPVPMQYRTRSGGVPVGFVDVPVGFSPSGGVPVGFSPSGDVGFVG